MDRKPPQILKPADVDAKGRWYAQRMNPLSRFRGTWLSRLTGLGRVVVDYAVLPPGQESFALHAHRVEEEWVYILEGQPTLLTEEGEVQLGPGDFVAFPAPQKAHNLANRTQTNVAYLMGGEAVGPYYDVVDFPKLGKSYALIRSPGQPTSFHPLGDAEQPFGAEEG